MLLLASVVPTAAGQNKARMQQLQQQLSAKLEMVSGAGTDNERYLASEEAVQLLTPIVLVATAVMAAGCWLAAKNDT